MEPANAPLLTRFHLKELLQQIIALDKHFIALQFPDSLLEQSVEIYWYLQEHLPQRTLFILGDTSYGECCIDEVNASHAATNDLIVHFGNTCFSTPSHLPTKDIIYVLPLSPDHNFSLTQEWTQRFKALLTEHFQPQETFIQLMFDLET
mmetsp:Transcript_41838/g.40191  ORF Transcript_41838/g.40191 Transcript_41838/m.40191 type:complete len:149 (+) Transcript_41838:7-453(+)